MDNNDRYISFKLTMDIVEADVIVDAVKTSSLIYIRLAIFVSRTTHPRGEGGQ